MTEYKHTRHKLCKFTEESRSIKVNDKLKLALGRSYMNGYLFKSASYLKFDKDFGGQINMFDHADGSLISG